MPKLISLIIVYLVQQKLKQVSLIKKLQHNCNAAWLDDFLFSMQALANKYPKIPSTIATAILILAVMTLVVLLHVVLQYTLGNLGLILFNIGLLFYCLYAAEKKNYSSVYVASFEHSFGLLFWFAVLGPVGLFIYWLLSLGRATTDSNSHLYSNKNITNIFANLYKIAAWLPARITGLMFSLVGDFDRGFATWKSTIKSFNMPHEELLQNCGEAAAASEESPTQEQAPILIERTFISWIIVCTLIIFMIDF